MFGWAGLALKRVATTNSKENGVIPLCSVLTLVDFGLEAGGHLFDSLAERGSFSSKLVELLFVWNKVRQVKLIVVHGDLRAHVHAKALRERGEINISLFLRVEDVRHQRGHLLLGNVNLVGEQVRFEILV